MRRHRAAVLAAVIALLFGASLASCSTTEKYPVEVPETDNPNTLQTVTVYAAASLKLGFEDIARAFEAEYDGKVEVEVLTDGSSTLAMQITEGAPADVFASADERNMATIIDEGMAEAAQLFATNSLVIAVPAGNPAGVETLADLADVTTVLCADAVPCGTASIRLLELAGVHVTPASSEQSVTAVLQKVAAGEADAGLVYATDVIGDTAVEHIVPDEARSIVNRYPIAVLNGAKFPKAAHAFVEFVTGTRGQTILAKRGFGGV